MRNEPQTTQPPEVPPSPPGGLLDPLLELVALAGMLICLLIVAFNYAGLPAEIPVHFTLAGAPDRWGGKDELWAIVGLVLVVCLALGAIARLMLPKDAHDKPVAAQLKLARRLVLFLNCEAALLFVIMLQQTVAVGRGTAPGLDPAGMTGMLVLMGMTLVVYLFAALRTAAAYRA
ncbi:DUF1648 domain-containing protein [bacterium]|nr:DUF1648 domain-containing protein [bacterium]